MACLVLNLIIVERNMKPSYKQDDYSSPDYRGGSEELRQEGGPEGGVENLTEIILAVTFTVTVILLFCV